MYQALKWNSWRKNSVSNHSTHYTGTHGHNSLKTYKKNIFLQKHGSVLILKYHNIGHYVQYRTYSTLPFYETEC